MPKTLSQREPGANADVLIPDEVSEIFGDGIASAQIGFPNTRLFFYRISEPAELPDGVEQRTVNHSVVVPTVGLIQFVLKLANAIRQDPETLLSVSSKSSSAFDQTIRKLVDDLNQ